MGTPPTTASTAGQTVLAQKLCYLEGGNCCDQKPSLTNNQTDLRHHLVPYSHLAKVMPLQLQTHGHWDYSLPHMSQCLGSPMTLRACDTPADPLPRYRPRGSWCLDCPMTFRVCDPPTTPSSSATGPKQLST